MRSNADASKHPVGTLWLPPYPYQRWLALVTAVNGWLAGAANGGQCQRTAHTPAIVNATTVKIADGWRCGIAAIDNAIATTTYGANGWLGEDP